jgi:large subunit ribosomal protein L29
MKIENIREMSSEDLVDEIEKLQQEIMHSRMSNAIGTSENPVGIRFARRDVARMLTVLREREMRGA